jgi:hypothetical protein
MTVLPDENEVAWNQMAEQRGYACERCGNPPSYDERDIYFETEYCGWCNYEVTRD